MGTSLGRALPRQATEDKVLGLLSDPFQGQIQVRAFWASLGLSIGLSVGLAILFSFLRPRHDLVYAPKKKHTDAKHAPPPVGRGPFEWLGPVWRTKEDILVEKLGLDAAVFLRFIRMLRNIFGIAGVLGLLIMLPVNVTTGNSAVQDKNNVFATMTPLYTWGNGLWAQVIMTYTIQLVVVYFLWHNYRRVYALKRAYFESPEYQQSFHARSVMIRHIPKSLRSNEGIVRVIEQVNPTGMTPIPIPARNVKHVPELIEEHEKAVRKLESVLAKYLKNPDRLPTKPLIKLPKGSASVRAAASGMPITNGKVDAIDYYRRLIEVYERNIDLARQQIDSRDIMSYGFAAWEQVSQAHVVAYAARKEKPNRTRITSAPKPSNIIWKNMTLSSAELKRKRTANAVYISLLTLLWTPINAGLAVFVSNLSNLGILWPSFQVSLQRNRAFWSIVQGVAAPALTSLFYLLLPIMLRRLQVRAGDVTKTQRDRHVLRNLFTFFIINNLLIFSLFSAFWQYITAIVNNTQDGNVWAAVRQGQFFLTITSQLCASMSPFWIIWILQRNLGAAIDLAQLWTLFYQWFARKFMSPTPRQHIEWTAPPPIDYAAYYNYFLFYSAIALVYATLQPLILLCTALYFTLDSVLKKYLLMYVFITKNESAGAMWRTLFNRLIFSCILADIVVAITVKARGTWAMVIALIPLVVILMVFKMYCARTFDSGMDYYTRTVLEPKEAERLGSINDPSMKALARTEYKFHHPALTRKLLTPMVSAKAKHIVSQIYSGRVSSDLEAYEADQADMPMQPLRARGEPRLKQPFEVVPDSQQDYEYFKDREDFEEAGGDNLGKPEDLIESRPNTPGPNGLANTLQSQAPMGKNLVDYSDEFPDAREQYGPAGVVQPQALRATIPRYGRLRQLDDNDEGQMTPHVQQRAYTDYGEDTRNLLPVAQELEGSVPGHDAPDDWRMAHMVYDRGDDKGSYEYSRGSTPYER